MGKSSWSPEKNASTNTLISDFSTIQVDTEDTTKEPETRKVPCPCLPTRYVMTALLFLGIFTIYTQRINLSVAIVAMLNTTALEESELKQEIASLGNSSLLDLSDMCPKPDISNSSDVEQPRVGKFIWTETTQGLVLGAFLYGYIPTQIIGGRMAEVVGGKITYGFGIVISTILSCLTPVAADSGIAALVTLRIIIGVAQGVNIPTIYAMISEWSLPDERSTLLAIALMGGHVGNIFTMPLTGVLCDSDFLGGWPAAFYVFGGLGCVTTVLWIFGAFDRPSLHPRISSEELALLRQVESPPGSAKVVVPWFKLLTSVPVLAACFTKMSLVWTYNIVSTKIPAYLESVLHLPIRENGLINAIIYGSLAVSMLVSAKICDRILASERFSKTTVRKGFQFISSFGITACLFSLGFVGCNTTAVVCLLASTLAFFGIASGGEQPNCFDLAPGLAGTISGLGNGLASTSGSMAPVVAGLFLEGKGNSLTQWKYVFYLTGGFSALGGIVFLLLASGEEQPWATTAQVKEVNEVKETKDKECEPDRSNLKF